MRERDRAATGRTDGDAAGLVCHLVDADEAGRQLEHVLRGDGEREQVILLG